MNFKKKTFKASLAAVTTLFSTVALSEDIEIYTAAIGASSTGTINPNVLFIMDTSGSMNATEAVRAGTDYDPDTDYGDNDDYIYVYDTDLDYQNVFFTGSQNRCKAAIDKFAATPEVPIFQGRVLQWTQCPAEGEVGGGGGTPDSSSVSGELDAGEADYTDEVELSDLEPGSTITLSADNEERSGEWLRFEIQYYNGSSWIDYPDCNNNDINGGTSDSCEVTLVNQNLPGVTGAQKIRGELIGWTNASNLDYSAELSFFREAAGVGQETIEISGQINKFDDKHTTDEQTLLVTDVEPGSTLTFEVNQDSSNGSNRELRFSMQYWNGSQWRTFNSCDAYTIVGGGSSDSCEVDASSFPGSATQVRGRVYRQYSSSIGYSAALYYTPVGGSGDGGVCPDNTAYEWTSSFNEDVSDSSIIFECEDDGGVHGNVDASTSDPGPNSLYIDYCPDDSSTCTDPYYVSLSGNELDWSDHNIYKLVSGNYHNYLQSDDFIDPDTLGSAYKGNQSIEDQAFCGVKSSGSEGKQVDNYFTSVEDGELYQCRKYIDIAKEAAIAVASQQTGVNIGVMRYRGTSGGYVVNHIEDVATNLNDFKNAVNALPASDGTPLSETYYEAYRYYAGKSAHFGDVTGKDADAFVSSSSTYKSPIVNACQSNNIIYLSDGQPSTSDDAAHSLIEGIDSSIGDCAGSNVSSSPDGSCLDELSRYMANNDMSTGESGVDGINTVSSFFIGFNEELPIFQEAATKGKGLYFEAEDSESLVNAFQQILVSIAVDKPTTLVAPAVSVNAFNELQHRDEIYYAIFEPSLTPRWSGNVKKFSIDGTGTVKDLNGDAAVDPDSGFFKDSSQSIWSDDEDGGKVNLGGFTEQSDNSRTIYVDGSVVGGSGIAQLTDSSTLSVGSDADEAIKVRDWLLGIDVLDQNNNGDLTDAHQFAADPLHSKPFVITYSGTGVSDSRDVLFVTTNLGMLHAIDARSSKGEELWAYMPGELMDNTLDYINNSSSSHTYGLDGEATVWTIEDTSTSGSTFLLSKAYMFQGMRRGGSNYFAWDITNALSNSETPISTMWTVPGNDTSNHFADLGQTWSKMVRTKMSWGCSDDGTGCTTKDVLVFSGGYDDQYYDDKTKLPKDSSSSVKGNAVYIVDALKGPHASEGGFIYKIGDGNSYDENLPMYNSIPADPSPIDSDGDGDMDILFFVDIAGHVWRVDFDQTEDKSNAKYTTGGMIADLYDGTNFRRFYNGLDISLSTPAGGNAHYNLVVGSGYRAFPKDDEAWDNAIYVIYDDYVSGPKLNDSDQPIYTYKEESDSSLSVIELADLHPWAIDDVADKATNAPYGFYRGLDANDEKILQSSVTFGSKVLVSSYIPAGTSTISCGSGLVGSGRTYLLDLNTGSGALVFDTDRDGDIDANDNDTYFDLAHDGIPPDPTILLVPELVVCIGTECTDDLLDLETGQAEKTYWREN